MVLLNTPVRGALNGVRRSIAEAPVFRGKLGPYTHRGLRNLLATSSLTGSDTTLRGDSIGWDSRYG